MAILPICSVLQLLHCRRTEAACYLHMFYVSVYFSVGFVGVESLASDLLISFCTSGKAIIDDPNFPAFPESAEEAHARMNAVLEVSACKLVFCTPMLISFKPDAAVATAVHCAGHRQSVSGKYTGCISWRGASSSASTTVMLQHAKVACLTLHPAPHEML